MDRNEDFIFREQSYIYEYSIFAGIVTRLENIKKSRRSKWQNYILDMVQWALQRLPMH